LEISQEIGTPAKSSEPEIISDGIQHWIERIFEIMSEHYGSSFADKWAHVDHESMKMEWCRRLQKLKPEQVRYGVDNIEQLIRVPILAEFIALCKQGRTIESHRLMLPKPPLTADQKERGLRILKEAKQKLKDADG
jgi:hypothetical protein